MTPQELFDICKGDKSQVAYMLGYLPPQIAWKAKSTYGLPLEIIADYAAAKGLKMDWYGIEYEAAKEGANISGEVKEARRDLLKGATKLDTRG